MSVDGDVKLRHLARLSGIVLRYRDLWGDIHDARSEPLRQVLRALGVSCESEAQIEAAIQASHEQRWRRIIPPVLVASEGENITFWVNVPRGRTSLTWRVKTDDGNASEGHVGLGALPRFRERVIQSERFRRYRVDLGHRFRPGYHEIELILSESDRASARLIVSPRQCFVPEGVMFGRKSWGVSAQLFSLVSNRNWGIGDFSDLRQLIDGVADAGGGVVGVSPLTALPLSYSEHCSPYSPQSRYALHPMFIDVERMDGFSESRECGELLQSDGVKELRRKAREGELINYSAVYELKILFFQALYRHFLQFHIKNESELAQDFLSFCQWRGEALRAYAVYEALQQNFGRNHLAWPKPYASWKSPQVAEFESSNRERVDFYRFLQWQAWKQLARLGEYSMHRGLAVGLYVDIPLGADGGGAEVWMDPELFVQQMSSGAPPDECNVKGQSWGLPPCHPEILRARRYEPFVQVMRCAMEQAGAVRIDHVMSLNRLFWVPEGTDPAQGVYVRYPLQDLLAIVRLESVRNRCLVVGEDLGTVPDVMRLAMDSSAIFSYRLFIFMNNLDGSWMEPQRYPERCVASFSSHDLSTLQGFWSSHDLMLREHFVLGDDAGLIAETREQRESDKQEIVIELSRALGRSEQEVREHLLASINAFLLQSPASIVLTSLEDIAGWVSQVNLPGVVAGYPSWRSKLRPNLEELTPRFADLRAGKV